MAVDPETILQGLVPYWIRSMDHLETGIYGGTKRVSRARRSRLHDSIGKSGHYIRAITNWAIIAGISGTAAVAITVIFTAIQR